MKSPIVLTYGYSSRQAICIVLPLLLILLAPLGLTLWMRARALCAEQQATATGKKIDPAVIWFGYGRYLQSLSIGIWVAWGTVLIAVQAHAFLTFLVGQSWVVHSGLPIILMYLPAFVIIACYGLSYPVFAQVRSLDYTRADLLRQAAWGQSRLLPLLCLLNGLTEYSFDQRLAMGWFAGAILLNILTAQGAMKALGSALEAVTTGELRDRVYALAAVARVPVRQLYVIRSGKGRLANAFASVGNNVLLTDFLLERLNKREVDAVIGHELTHLKRRHPQALQIVFLVVFIGAGILAGYTQWWTSLASLSGAVYAALALAGLFLSYGLSRRFEWAADAGSVALTGDGEALITGLAKISHLNQTPLHWGKWHEKWLTHPPTIQRMQRLGQAVGLSAHQVEMLARPEAVLSQENSFQENSFQESGIQASNFQASNFQASGLRDGFYMLAARQPETQIFSTRRKVNLIQGLFWLSVLLTPGIAVFATLLVAWAAQSRGCVVPLQWLLLMLGVVLALAIPRLLQDSLQRPWFARLERLLRQKLEAEGVLEAAEALSPNKQPHFVTYSPHPFPRLYERFYDWDIGFLILGPNQLRYAGEKVQFALTASQVVGVELREDTPSAWKSWSRLYLHWRDASDGFAQGFNLCPGSTASVWQSRRAAGEMLQQIREWQAGAVDSAPSVNSGLAVGTDPAAFPAPSREEVTAISPRGLITIQSFVHALIVQLGLAAGLCLLVGLPFNLDFAAQGKWPQGLGGWYVLIVTFVALIVQCVPFWRYRDQSQG